MKIITMYLPQFYENEHNSKWWGEGYTDWVAVKEAEQYFKTHNQPRVPLEHYYYNLLEKETMQWQVTLMKKYGIYGQCFYHYWFKDGKMALEKPAENLLKWQEIDMPFCFSWANQSWTMSWSKRDNSAVWSRKYEVRDCNETGILLEQQYGGRKQWKEHFEYLLPFFKDSRYIKKDGRPVFMIYEPNDIVQLEEMIQTWNELAYENNIPNLYIINANTNERRNADALYKHMTSSMMPEYFYLKNNGVRCVQYNAVWDYILQQGKFARKGTIIGGMIDFDTTPRKGKQGIVTLNCDSQTYNYYLKRLLKINEELENEFTFINAWNEWGEGMYLEPDQRNGYAFLEATKNALEEYQNVEINNKADKDDIALMEYYQKQAQKFRNQWKYTDRLLYIAERKESIGNNLLDKGIRKIAIYGWGYLGKHIYQNLLTTDVDIKYIIDQHVKSSGVDIPLLSFEDKWECVDAIILTVIDETESLKAQIREKLNVQIVGLGEIL